MKNELLIFIPTYNEIENVELLLSKLLSLQLNADILFVDDNSPDGTGTLLDKISAPHSHVFVHHRHGKEGIGNAHAYGINWAYDTGYSTLITMDCDFTHSPEDIPTFLNMKDKADIILGSRYTEKKSLDGWSFHRRLLTHLGHFATRFFLKMPYDATGAFRLYRLDKISRNFLNLVHSTGYSFFFESLHILFLNAYTIAEIPILLPKRMYGHSKMKIRDALHSLLHLSHTYFKTLLNSERLEISKATHLNTSSPQELVNHQDWDSYWSDKGKKSPYLIYDLLAAFYRKCLIKPSLNYFISKHFTNGSHLLHAGCGSGQVDSDIGHKYAITALDISATALEIYKKTNKNCEHLIHGSIFNIESEAKKYDGVYNLGVMEHFNEQEIEQILSQFQRVLKPNGKLVLFWPPEFGLSVIALKFIHFILNKVLKKNVILHPPEISRIRSKLQVKNYLNTCGFKLIEFKFGIRDLFTYVVVVAERTEAN